jgi:hypothetical protein
MATTDGQRAESDADVRRYANISPDGLYRWSLHREWRAPLAPPRWVTFVMLNPSTADASVDDPTIRRCIGFARAFGATGLAVVNLYGLRATSPKDLWKAADPVGLENDSTLRTFLAMAAAHDMPIIAAWGAHAEPDRVAAVRAMPGAERLQALRVTKDGAPGHPLYLPSTAIPQPWPTRVLPPESGRA